MHHIFKQGKHKWRIVDYLVDVLFEIIVHVYHELRTNDDCFVDDVVHDDLHDDVKRPIDMVVIDDDDEHIHE